MKEQLYTIPLTDAFQAGDECPFCFVQRSLEQLAENRTSLVIAHRLSTVRNADQILVIDGGTVAQRGTHKELLQQEGTYKKFIQIREQAEGWRIQ